MSNRKQHAGRSRLMVGVPLAAGLLAVTTLPTWAAPGFQPPVTNVACSTSDLINKIVAANAASGPQILSLAAGCNYLLSTLNNSTFGPSGTPVITNAIGIQGNGATISRSTATGTPNFRILTVGPTGRLSIDAVTISGGVADCGTSTSPSSWCTTGSPSVAAFGGGIGVVGGQLNVVKAKFLGNSATCGTVAACNGAAGGAIGAQDNGTNNPAIVVITDSFLADNTATCTDTTKSKCALASGGAVDVTNSDLHVLHSRFHDNSVSCTNTPTTVTTCTNAFGGALEAGGSPDQVTVADSEFDHNSATSSQDAAGGAIAVIDASAALSGNRIRANSATGSREGLGGGVFVQLVNAKNLSSSISDGSVDHNSATGNVGAGGGIVAAGDVSLADLKVTDNIVSGQETLGGGVISIGSLRAARTEIDENRATGAANLGGGVFAEGQLVLQNGSVSRNRIKGTNGSVGGGVVVLGGAASLVDERVAGNSITDPTEALGGGVLAEGTVLLVQGGRVSDNSVSSTSSGGALGGGVLTGGGQLGVVGGARIEDNSANGPGADGGGIFNSGGNDVVDSSSRVTGNVPDQCAGTPVVGC